MMPISYLHRLKVGPSLALALGRGAVVTEKVLPGTPVTLLPCTSVSQPLIISDRFQVGVWCHVWSSLITVIRAL